MSSQAKGNKLIEYLYVPTTGLSFGVTCSAFFFFVILCLRTTDALFVALNHSTSGLHIEQVKTS